MIIKRKFKAGRLNQYWGDIQYVKNNIHTEQDTDHIRNGFLRYGYPYENHYDPKDTGIAVSFTDRDHADFWYLIGLAHGLQIARDEDTAPVDLESEIIEACMERRARQAEAKRQRLLYGQLRLIDFLSKQTGKKPTREQMRLNCGLNTEEIRTLINRLKNAGALSIARNRTVEAIDTDAAKAIVKTTTTENEPTD